ncbi:type IV pilin protein [Tenacibaculum finnmarkense]|uniref:type IV pilin protein n=1 Tax=Tenacibaculum finnmarkense TaxID=2781243 RepID=UPI001E65230F|nr:prepilin-type N-terminal cleavage/methylation domain-containing protein [Tenacibaculum finnmarkense]MCD8406197.1 prepilin-type N-terminal cleavage/methylation domain-containing protein [Tenacibaculum dicentrarchi]MCD8413423.1 prepilin-type N-terminal cleavage/methylation domain-containing protein [Tenacibaculum finnmarkense genomovar ulcerans]MCG8208144.1 prepilin-type N-terminal cleavage/methylation domain-containing protein [Tenacibaculum finnmarkense genomovar finnmarkense]MCG8724146.1 pr
MKNKFKDILLKKTNAFNLQELLVVLVIIGILILIALPSLMPLISKAKKIEAQSQLKHLHNMQRNYFYMHSKYSNDFNAIDFILPKTVNQGGTSNYSYEIIEATNNSFKAKAIAISDFDGDGIFNVWEINQDNNLIEIVKD